MSLTDDLGTSSLSSFPNSTRRMNKKIVLVCFQFCSSFHECFVHLFTGIMILTSTAGLPPCDQSAPTGCPAAADSVAAAQLPAVAAAVEQRSGWPTARWPRRSGIPWSWADHSCSSSWCPSAWAGPWTARSSSSSGGCRSCCGPCARIWGKNRFSFEVVGFITNILVE